MCVFCRVIEGKQAARIVCEDEHGLVFHDIEPQAPVHMLVIPRKHIETLDETSADDEALLGRLLGLARQAARKLHISDQGYRVVINCGPAACQSIYHLHLHVIGGRNMDWPPG